MKISIIGAGNIGKTLGQKWASKGHDVTFGLRSLQPEKVQALMDTVGNNVTTATIDEALTTGEVILFALPAKAFRNAIPTWADNLAGKILIDATNFVGQTPMHSLDVLREHTTNTVLIRAFSNLGWENFAQPTINDQQVDLFYCGDQGDKQNLIHQLIVDIGLNPIYIGGVEQGDIIDALTRLWFTLALQQGKGRRLALKLILHK